MLERGMQKASEFAALDPTAFVRTKLDFRGADIDRINAGLAG